MKRKANFCELQEVSILYSWNVRLKERNITTRCVVMYRSSPPEVFLAKGVLKICSKFTREHPCQNAISIKLFYNFIEIALQHGCSPVNFLHIFITPFPRNTSWEVNQIKLCTGWNSLNFNSFYLVSHNWLRSISLTILLAIISVHFT